MISNSVLLVACFVLTFYNEVAGSLSQEGLIEDEAMSEFDKESFQVMMDQITSKNEKEEIIPPPTCPHPGGSGRANIGGKFAGMGGLGGLGSLGLGGMGGMGGLMAGMMGANGANGGMGGMGGMGGLMAGMMGANGANGGMGGMMAGMMGGNAGNGGMGGMGGLMSGMMAGMMGGKGGMGGMEGMNALNRLSSLAGGLPPSVEPKAFAGVLLTIVNALEERIQKAIAQNELGVCPRIKPMDIFLLKDPYLAHQEVLSLKEGVEAMGKINSLKTDLNNFLA